MAATLFKICSSADWQTSQAQGYLRWSADDERDGFIHLSTADQVPGTLARHFAGQVDLCLLEIDGQKLPAGVLRWEPSRGGELFPHAYGDIPGDAVVGVTRVGG